MIDTTVHHSNYFLFAYLSPLTYGVSENRAFHTFEHRTNNEKQPAYCGKIAAIDACGLP